MLAKLLEIRARLGVNSPTSNQSPSQDKPWTPKREKRVTRLMCCLITVLTVGMYSCTKASGPMKQSDVPGTFISGFVSSSSKYDSFDRPMSETITFNVDGTVDYALQGEERSHSQKANWVFCADCYKDDYGKQSTINLDIELSLGTWQVKDRFVLLPLIRIRCAMMS